MAQLALSWIWGGMRQGMRELRENVQSLLDEDDDTTAPNSALPSDDETSLLPPYQYSPLPQTLVPGVRGAPFRLLHLLPGRGLDPLGCLLVESFLDEQSDQYEALSYVWGDVTDQLPVKVDGAMLRIGQSLRRALLALRLEDAPRIIWVDAMCINQEDMDERAHQVSIMREIYRYASQTVVWFGDSTKETKTAFAYIQRLFDEAKDWEKHPEKRLPSRTGSTYKEIMPSSVLENVFADNIWWNRIWTAQEILLAKRATIVSGKHHIPWDVFLEAIHHGAALEIWGFPLLGVPWVSPFAVVDDTLALKNTQEFPTPADEMLFFLFRARNREATDPRDKIFALLGLISGDVRGALGIQADYRATAEDVFRNAMARLLDNSENLDALGLCYPYKTRTVHELPSWVPDWGSTGFLAHPMMEDSKRNPRSTHASKHHSAQVDWDDGGTTLIIDGHSQGNITHLTRARPEIDGYDWRRDEFPMDDDSSIRQKLSDMVGLLGVLWENLAKMIGALAIYLEWEEFVVKLEPANPGLGAGDPLLVYCLTLCTGTLAPGGLSETHQMFKTWIQKFAPIRKLRGWKFDEGKGTYRLLSLLGFIKSTWSDPGEFVHYTTHTEDRRLGATSNGHLALLPKHTEIGDELIILKGGRFPVVLRPRDDGSMQFIGEAYVQGIMDGEAFREQDCVKLRIR